MLFVLIRFEHSKPSNQRRGEEHAEGPPKAGSAISSPLRWRPVPLASTLDRYPRAFGRRSCNPDLGSATPHGSSTFEHSKPKPSNQRRGEEHAEGPPKAGSAISSPLRWRPVFHWPRRSTVIRVPLAGGRAIRSWVLLPCTGPQLSSIPSPPINAEVK